MQLPKMLPTRRIWRRRLITTLSLRCHILFVAVLFFHGATLDLPLAVGRNDYLLAGGGSGPIIQPGITFEEDTQMVSGPPGSVEVKHAGGLHEIRWLGTREDSILGYQVYRRCPPNPWISLGFVELRDDDPRNEGLYIFQDQFPGNCEYTVAAVGPDGKPGPKSVEIQ